MAKNTIQLSPDDARSLVYGELVPGYSVVVDELTDTGRWSIHHRIVVQELETGRFYAAYYTKGATENQDEIPFQYDSVVTFTEVEKRTKTVTYFA